MTKKFKSQPYLKNVVQQKVKIKLLAFNCIKSHYFYKYTPITKIPNKDGVGGIAIGRLL